MNQDIKDVVYTFAKIAKIEDTQVVDKLVMELSSMNVNDAIDRILVSLNSMAMHGDITPQDLLDNVELLIKLNPEQYKSKADLINRLNWIKGMNLEYPAMPLTENHKLVVEAFDAFNDLMQSEFDCYYTGGLMGYLATDHPLERYHGDLDLFINEDQLKGLMEFLKDKEDFEFVSNMDHKETNGHEYKIVYKGTPMSIGLFLFRRMDDGGMTLCEYYYPEMNPDNGLCVNERHLSPEYVKLCFSDQFRKHGEAFYRMMSLENIYNSKKGSRPKDRYDALVIKDLVDMSVEKRIDELKASNYEMNHVRANDSVVAEIERIMKNGDSPISL